MRRCVCTTTPMKAIIALLPPTSLGPSVVSIYLMICGCIITHESQLNFMHSLRQMPGDTAPPLVETFTLRDGGEIRLMADSRFNTTHMVAMDHAGHVINVASVFATAARNDRLTAQVLALIHSYHLMSMASERGDTTWLYVFSRAYYAGIACFTAFVFVESYSRIDAGAPDVERVMAACYAAGGVLASIMIVAKYTHIMLVMSVSRPAVYGGHVLSEADLYWRHAPLLDKPCQQSEEAV